MSKGRILIVRGAASWLTADIIPYQLKAASPVRVRAINPPNQRGEAAPELEVSLGEGATLPGLLGPLRGWPVGGHQVGQAGSRSPHAGGKRRIAIRALRPELRLANCSRNAHLTLRQSRTPAAGSMNLGTARWCAWGHQRALRRGDSTSPRAGERGAQEVGPRMGQVGDVGTRPGPNVRETSLYRH